MTQTFPGTSGQLPRRPYGRTGASLSVVGMGGIVLVGSSPGRAKRLVAQAVERGVNYFDVAPTYGDSEELLGPALEPYRGNCFLACKTTQRDAESARRELERSLRRLRTDYLDLYQLHGLVDVQKDVDAAFARGGAMEVLLEARRAGQVRHLGFSAHSEQAALAALDRCDFDSLLLPINFVCWHKGRFGPRVVQAARQKQMTVLALKALVRRPWPENAPDRDRYRKCWCQPVTDRHEAALALRFTLGQPVAAALPPGHEELFWLAVSLGSDAVRPLSPAEDRELQALAETLEPIFTT